MLCQVVFAFLLCFLKHFKKSFFSCLTASSDGMHSRWYAHADSAAYNTAMSCLCTAHSWGLAFFLVHVMIEEAMLHSAECIASSQSG